MQEVLEASVKGWHPSVAAGGSTTRMASHLRLVLGTSLDMSEKQKYKEAVLCGMTVAWGIKIMALALTSAQSLLSAVCYLLLGVAPVRAGAMTNRGAAEAEQSTGQASTHPMDGVGYGDGRMSSPEDDDDGGGP